MITRVPGPWRRDSGRAPWTTYRKIVVSTVSAVVVAAAGFGVYSLVSFLGNSAATCENQGLTVVTHAGSAGECVGITDGTYQFVPGYQPLVRAENDIRAEDQSVRMSGKSYVSIAYLLPISPTGGGVEASHTAAEQVEGAYTAQYYANRNNVDGTAPQIQVLIASSGTQAAQYGTTVRDIENDTGAAHLVAVAGIGVSLDTTVTEVKKLAGDGIPVFGSTITSDEFDGIENMVRVAPSNAQEIDAALRFIKPQAKTAFLIQDTNPDDTYDTTIVKEFQDSFPDATHALAATESYNSAGEVSSSDPAGEEVANRLGLMPSDICESGAGLVLFAGRGRDLGALITDLGERPCLNKRITILTADDVTNMPVTAPIEKGLRSGVTLDYAGLASPSEWTTGTGGSWQGYTQFSGAFGSRFPRVSYSDGNAMMGYDATLTAISAIRLASVQHIVRSPLGVAQVLSALQGSRVVPGASGPISFSANNGPQGSNPVGKVIPIFQIQPSGAITFVHLES